MGKRTSEAINEIPTKKVKDSRDDYRKDECHYYLCQICNEWTETEGEMEDNILLNHNSTGLKEAIDENLERFPFQIRDIYEDIELLFKEMLNEKIASKIYKDVHL